MSKFRIRPLLAMMGLVSKASTDAAAAYVTGHGVMNLVDNPAPDGPLKRALRHFPINPKARALRKLREKIDKWCHEFNSKVRTRQVIRHSLRRYYFAQFRKEFGGENRTILRRMARAKTRNTWFDFKTAGQSI